VRIFRSVLAVVAVLVLTLNGTLSFVAAQGTNGSSPLKSVPAEAMLATVVSVIDGDEFTAEVSGNEYRFSFLGVIAPNAPSGNDLGQCFGYDAAMRLSQLFKLGTQVFLSAEGDLDLSKASDRKATAVYVWLENPKELGTGYLVNTKLLRDGNADTSNLSKAPTYRQKFEDTVKKAKDGDKGLWKSCTSASDKVKPTPTPPPTDGELKAQYVWVQDAREILTRPFNHLGEKYAFCGVISFIQVARPGYVLIPGDTVSTEFSTMMQIRPDVSEERFMVGFNGDTSGMFEDSYVCVWGTLIDTASGTNAFGGSITNPLFDAEFVELQ